MYKSGHTLYFCVRRSTGGLNHAFILTYGEKLFILIFWQFLMNFASVKKPTIIFQHDGVIIICGSFPDADRAKTEEGG